MHIRFKKSHKSIKTFTPHEVGDFVIVTGVNGSGKTHLLEALAGGNLRIDGIAPQKLKYYNSTSFQASIEVSATPAQAYQEREATLKNFLSKRNQQLTRLRGQLDAWGIGSEVDVAEIFFAQ
ncbi:MAG: hypothetical protein P1U68_17520 [Verrucomicrobiales bacterium]|nr:hypothetical protein [Verrucomicrobiales bacterium]